MEYVRLGRAGLRVSRLALGTMNLGTVTGPEESFAILDAAVEAGVTLIDTADGYGGPPLGTQPGLTEELIGRWLTDRGIRDSVVLATKVYGVTGAGPNDRGLSSLHIKAAAEASLRRLNTDRIDLYQLHHIDPEVEADEVLEALTTLRQQGKIRYCGSSNFPGWRLAEYREKAAGGGLIPIVSEQSVYNLTKRVVELEVIPAAEHYGIALLPWAPLAGGRLAGSSRPEPGARRPAVPAAQQSGIERYQALAERLGVPPAQLGLAWLLHQPAVTSPVLGPRTVRQLLDSMPALDVTLEPADLAELDDAWPGPGGPAPRAYAW